MVLISADIGNSAIKLAFGGLEDSASTWQPIELARNRPIDIDLELPDVAAFWSICSVNSSRCGELRHWIAKHRPEDLVHEIHESEIPIRSNIECRATTGRDRLVAAWQAGCISANDRPIVVVDAGTAVTIDWIDADRVFQGGVIFPGAIANLRALSFEANALPDLSKLQREVDIGEVLAEVFGRDTQMAILCGVFHSQLASMTTMVDSYCSRHGGQCNVIATGGGIQRLANYLPGDWRIVPDLVLQGTMGIGRSLLTKASENR